MAKITAVATGMALLAASCAALGAGQCRPIRPSDLRQGAAIARTCAVCHAKGLSAQYTRGEPAYSAPRIEHQRAAYIRAALMEYRDGIRSSPIMRAQAKALTLQEIRDVAAYYDTMPDDTNESSPHPRSPAPVRRVALDRIPLIHRQVCGLCHGEAGLGILPHSPMLAGQYADYLEHALRAYASGARRSRIMGPFARMLTPKQRHEVAQYFSQQSMPERLPGSPMNLPLPLR